MTTEIEYYTKEEALTAVTKNGFELKHCSLELQNDENVVMTAIKQNEWSFQYASDDLKSNKAFAMKALNEGVYPWGVLNFSNIIIQADIEVMSFAIEKSDNGWVFSCAQGEAALNKELAAKALVKWGNINGKNSIDLCDEINPTLQAFFPEDSWYKKAQAYLIQLEQEKQAKMTSGGSAEEDEVVW